MRYDLDKLGWLEFENLVKAILKIRFGDGVEASGSLHDGGRESFYYGRLRYPTNEALHDGPFFFQCKFIQNASSAGADPAGNFEAHINSERTAIRRRISGEARFHWTCLPKHYVLFTNAPLNATILEDARSKIAADIPGCQVHIHQGADVCAWIDCSPAIALRFPQLFSIADFQLLLRAELDRDTQRRSETAVKLAENISSAFVPTAPYRTALQKLSAHNFVILEGPPEMGKTSIARMIALARFKDGWEAIECRKPSEVLSSYETDKKQIFVADDCFGQTDYRPERVGDWQGELSFILPRLDSRHQLILTSRAHLWQMAKKHLVTSGRVIGFPDIGEVVVNASAISISDKARILYRHAKLAALHAAIKEELKSCAIEIVKNPHFTPERVRLLVHAIKNQSPADT